MAGHFMGGTVFFYSNSTIPPSVKIKKFKPKFQLEVEPGRCLQGWVTHIENPFQFYIQFMDRKSNEFSKMLEELSICASQSPVSENPQIGYAYVALNGREWSRVLLEKVTPIGLVIFFIDFGHRDVVEVSRLHQLDSKFLVIPAQAVLCHLANVMAPEPWPSQSCSHFKELVDSRFVDVFVNQTYLGEVGRINKKEAKLFVTMYVEGSEGSINSKMVNLGGCTGIGPLEESWHMDSIMPVRLTHYYSTLTSYDKFTGPQKVDHGGKVLTTLPEVTVSHVVDPGKFFVQHRSEDSQKLHSALINKLAPDLPKPRDIVTGEMYAVQDFVSKQWFRGQRVSGTGRTSLSGHSIFNFFLIDEGSTIQVAASGVRQINAELKKFSPMIHECALKLETPPNGWSRELASQFKNMVLHKKLRMTVFSIDNGVRIVGLQPINADGTVAESALEEVLQQTAEKKTNKPAESLRKYVSSVDRIEKGAALAGKVVAVNGPGDFFILFDDSEAFHSFNAQLQEEYDQCHTWNTFKIITLQKGFPFVVRHQGQWFRVLVEEPLGVNQVVVYFVDSGLRLTVSSSQLLPIHDRFMKFPVTTFPCKLYGVCSKHASGMWSDESNEAFKSMASNAKVTVFIEGKIPNDLGTDPGKGSPLQVVLYCGDDSDSVNKRFTRSGHGISVRKHDMASHNRPDSLPSDSLSSNRLELSSPPQSVVSESSEFSNRIPTRKISLSESCFNGESRGSSETSCAAYNDEERSCMALSDLDLLFTEPKAGTFSPVQTSPAAENLAAEVAALECPEGIAVLDDSTAIIGERPPEGSYVIAARFLMCQSPDAIYFRPLPYETRYQQMMSDMQHVYRTSSAKIKPVITFDVGSRCAAFVYGHWIRINILDLDADLRCTAVDMDNGQPHILAAREIFPLVEPFSSVPKLALKCSLRNAAKRPGHTIASDVTSALLPADEIYLCLPSRPKAIPPILSASIMYTNVDAQGKTFVNLNSHFELSHFGFELSPL